MKYQTFSNYEVLKLYLNEFILLFFCCICSHQNNILRPDCFAEFVFVVFKTFCCSGQFYQDIRSQLENDFMKSLESEVRPIKYISLDIFCATVGSFYLRCVLLLGRWLMVMKGYLLDHYLGIPIIWLGIQIFPECSCGRTKLLRGTQRLAKLLQNTLTSFRLIILRC